MKIAVFIILYNEYLEESIAYNSLTELGLDVFVFDNSDQDNYITRNSTYSQVESFGQNFGLSLVYNYLISKYKMKYDFIMTSDSDSEYNDNFLEKFLEIKNEEALVYLPYIWCKKSAMMMYPRKYINKHIRFFKLPPVVEKFDNTSFFTSINTGTIYSTKVFKDLQFNDNLAIDLIDYDMFDQLKLHNISEIVFDSVVIQDFSGHDKLQSYTNGRIRYTFKDRLEYYGPIWYLYGIILYFALTLRERDFRYIKAYFDIHLLNRDNETLNSEKLKYNFKKTVKTDKCD